MIRSRKLLLKKGDFFFRYLCVKKCSGILYVYIIVKILEYEKTIKKMYKEKLK